MKKDKHYLGHRKRLRERFLSAGIDSLQEYEIVELLLTFVLPQMDVKPIAKELLNKFGSIRGIFDASEDELKTVPYIKEKAVVLIKFIKEISALYRKQKSVEASLEKSIDDLASYCIEKFGDKKEGEFHVLYLNTKFHLIQESSFPSKEFYLKGTIDKTVVYPRAILEEALKKKAYAMVIVHNHPNGNVQPSEYDINLTKILEIGAKSLGMILYDHLIVSSNSHFSFKKERLL